MQSLSGSSIYFSTICIPFQIYGLILFLLNFLCIIYKILLQHKYLFTANRAVFKIANLNSVLKNYNNHS